MPRTKYDADLFYKECYGSGAIHCAMLEDKVRMTSYKSAITPQVFKDKLVLDVGCGTGILSLWAARAGAKHVVAVEHAEPIAKKARQIIKKNKLSHKITVYVGNIESESLNDKLISRFQDEFQECQSLKVFDIVMSEWMGYALFFENMLPSVIHARNNFLKRDGLILPDFASLYTGGVESDRRHLKFYRNFFNDIDGFDFSDMNGITHANPSNFRLYENELITTTQEVMGINLYTVEASDLDVIKFSSVLTCRPAFQKFGRPRRNEEPKILDAVCLFFKVKFYVIKKVSPVIVLSTSPADQPTHWKQTIFRMTEQSEVSVRPLDRVLCVIELKPREEQKRHYDVTVLLTKLPIENSEGDTKIDTKIAKLTNVASRETFDWKTHVDYHEKQLSVSNCDCFVKPIDTWDYFNRTSDEDDDSKIIVKRNFLTKQIQTDHKNKFRTDSKTEYIML